MNFKDLPDIEIILNRRENYGSNKLIMDKIILKPEDYIIEGKKIKNNLDVQNDQDFSDLFPNVREECRPAFMPIDVPKPRGPILVFGEYFLRKFYTVFDRDQNVLGFATANHEGVERKNINLDIVTPYDELKTEEIIVTNKTDTIKLGQTSSKDGALEIKPSDDSDFFKDFMDETTTIDHNLDSNQNLEDKNLIDEFNAENLN